MSVLFVAELKFFGEKELWDFENTFSSIKHQLRILFYRRKFLGSSKFHFDSFMNQFCVRMRMCVCVCVCACACLIGI